MISSIGSPTNRVDPSGKDASPKPMQDVRWGIPPSLVEGAIIFPAGPQIGTELTIRQGTAPEGDENVRLTDQQYITRI